MSEQPVTRIGDKTSGHNPFPPRPTKGPGVGGSEDVFVNELGVNREGDEWEPHGRPGGRHASSSDYKHITEKGEPTVLVNNKPIARIGDPVDRDGDAIAGGSPNVFAGSTVPFSVPSVVIPAAAQAAIDQQTAAYVANPSAYRVSSNNQVKGNYPGTPQTPPDSGTSLIDPNAAGGDIVSYLTSILSQAAAGQWEETGMGGKPSNPRITGIWTALGYPATGAWTTDQTAWCMGFVNYVLKNTGHRFVQTAWALDIQGRAAQYNAVSVPLNAGQPGDIALWSYRHVNFIYTANAGRYTFVGGNQSSSAKNANNPSSGSVTKSWPGGYAVPGDRSLVSLWRPSKA